MQRISIPKRKNPPKFVEMYAIHAVIVYEHEHGRIAKRVPDSRGYGYDVHSAGDDEERHIEVKGQDKSGYPTFLKLYRSEYNRLQTDPNFWVYFVHSIETSDPKVVTIPRETLQKFRIKPSPWWTLSLSKTELNNLEQQDREK